MRKNNNISENAKFRELTSKSTLYNGKYIIEKVLGMGGFGITYYARHATLRKYYAIKEFFINGFCVRNTQTREVHLQGITDEEYDRYKQRFIEEAQTLAKLDHPNIVKIIDIFEENNTSYIVMPFIEGFTLQQVVSQVGKLNYETAVNYIAQISEAIGYIHERNILHRDISPDNVIISPDNKIILIDFGSAREFVHDKTQNHTAILKKGYAPLEQYSVNSRKGAYSDIYSLGAVFYFALTGQKPMDVTERTMAGNMPEPMTLDISIPKDANRTIMKAMSLSYKDRHQNIQEFMDDLLGEIPSKPKKPSKSRKKNIVFLCITILLLTGVATWAYMRHRNAEMVESDFQQYSEMVKQAKENYDNGEDSYVVALENYAKAADYEGQYANSEYAEKFNLDAENKKNKLNNTIDSLFNCYKKTALESFDIWQKGAMEERVIAKHYAQKALKLKKDNDLFSKIEILK